jgi:hypothetical protein
MSERRPAEARRFTRLGALARASLSLVLMGLAGQGCLITGDPQLDPPEQTPPMLLSVSPATYQQYTLGGGPGTVAHANVSFEVISEDLGQQIQGFIYLDFQGADTSHNAAGRIQPPKLPLGHLGPHPNVRTGTADFTFPAGTTGCHTATIVLSHEFDALGPANSKDVAIATWYYQIADDPLNPSGQGQSCLTGPPPSAGDAGSDGAMP